jgi:hypothetical protein
MSRCLIAVAASLALAISSPAQGLEGLFKELGKNLEQAAIQANDNPCLAKQAVAEVTTVKQDTAGWVVETVDGKTYQLTSLAVGGVADNGHRVGEMLGMARYASFSTVADNPLFRRYRVELELSDLVGSGKSGLTQALSSALNNTARAKSPGSSFQADISSFQGTSLDGQDWCLSPSASAVRGVRQISPSN